MGIHNPSSKYKIIFKLKIFGVNYIMGIQSTGAAAAPQSRKLVTTTVPLSFVVSAEIISNSPSSVEFNITNNNPNASLWFTGDPAITTATAAAPCIEIPVGGNADFKGNTAVRAVWPAGTTGAGCRIIQTLVV
jgi:hypothetical protein